MISFQDCVDKFDEAVNCVRTNVDIVKQANLFKECVLFLKHACIVLKQLENKFTQKSAKKFIATLNNMISDVSELGVKSYA